MRVVLVVWIVVAFVFCPPKYLLFVVLLKERVRVERQDALGFQEARPIEETAGVEILLPKYLIRQVGTCPGDQGPVADVLASSFLLSNGTQVRSTRTFQEFGHVGAGQCVRTSLQETVGKRCFAFCVVIHPVVMTLGCILAP